MGSDAAPGPVIAGISPELAALHSLAPRMEDGAARLIGEEFWRCLQELEQARLQRSQQRCCLAHPISQRGNRSKAETDDAERNL